MPFLLTNSALLTGNVVLNPLETQIEEAHVDFVEECVKHFKNILTKDENGDDLADDDARPDIGRQPIKLCVLGKPNTRGEQTLGSETVSQKITLLQLSYHIMSNKN